MYVWATPPPHPPLRAGAVRSCGAGTFLQLRRCHDLLSYSTLRASKMRVRRTQRQTELPHSFLWRIGLAGRRLELTPLTPLKKSVFQSQQEKTLQSLQHNHTGKGDSSHLGREASAAPRVWKLSFFLHLRLFSCSSRRPALWARV